jgi:hypothetical protein
MDMSGELDEMMEAWGLIGRSQCDPMHAPFGIVGKSLWWVGVLIEVVSHCLDMHVVQELLLSIEQFCIENSIKNS